MFLSFYLFEETIGKIFLIETAEKKMHGSDYQEAGIQARVDALKASADELKLIFPNKGPDFNAHLDEIKKAFDKWAHFQLFENEEYGSDYQEAGPNSIEARFDGLKAAIDELELLVPNQEIAALYGPLKKAADELAAFPIPNLDTVPVLAAFLNRIADELEAALASVASHFQSQPDQAGNQDLPDQAGNQDIPDQAGNQDLPDEVGSGNNFYV